MYKSVDRFRRKRDPELIVAYKEPMDRQLGFKLSEKFRLLVLEQDIPQPMDQAPVLNLHLHCGRVNRAEA